MRRLAWLSLLALSACAGPAAPPPTAVAASPPACRVGPDGARPLADRGIGGTGAPAVRTVDRGIGGTGIIGVITGFASVCVAGEEVALPAGLPARIDGLPGSLDDLRAGQVVALQATGPAGGLLAREIVVRHVVIGPVQASGDGAMTVAGQAILVGNATGSANGAAPGRFVAVSGFRQPGGMIVATRIDPAPAGPVLLRGELTRIFDTARIGSQTVRLPDGANIPGGFPIVVTGSMQGGVLVADSAARDIADESPAAYFGPAVSDFIVEGYLSVVAGGYLVSRDFVRGEAVRAESRGRGIAVFSRRPEGGLAARGAAAASGSDRGFLPAPLAPGADGLGGSGFDQGRQGFLSPRSLSPGSFGSGATGVGPQSPPPRR